MAPILSVRNLSTGYGKKQVLFEVSLDVMPSEILLIAGGNGSGRSTPLKRNYGLLPPWCAAFPRAGVAVACRASGQKRA